MGERNTGKVMWFNDKKGHGYIAQILAHYSLTIQTQKMTKRLTGNVKCFDKNTGQGLITPDDGSEDHIVLYTDIYAHLGEYQSLGKGEEVEFVVGPLTVVPMPSMLQAPTEHLSPAHSALAVSAKVVVEATEAVVVLNVKTTTGPIELCLQCGFCSSTGGDESHGGGGSGGGGEGTVGGSGGGGGGGGRFAYCYKCHITSPIYEVGGVCPQCGFDGSTGGDRGGNGSGGDEGRGEC